MAKVETGRPVMGLLWLSNDEGHCGGDEKYTIWGHNLKLEEIEFAEGFVLHAGE